MCKLIFSKKITKATLKKADIVIQNSDVEEGAEIENSVAIINSKIASTAKVSSYSVIKNSIVGANVNITASYIEDSAIGENTNIGPFAHIRMNCSIGKDNRIGNFVELKNVITGDNCKMAHLTYVGDAEIGNNCNIGCGVVFCNYNGKLKQKTIVGNNVFVGSNVNLVAPLKIGDNVYIAAGSTINQDVCANEFAIARARQTNKQNFNNPYLDK